MGKTEKNNLAIALNILRARKENICVTHVSKHNSNREKQVTCLIIPNGQGWHYLEVEELSALLRGITPKHTGIFIA